MRNLESTLREAARKSGLSMKAIADQTETPYASIHQFMVHDRSLLTTTASKLAALLGLELRPVRRAKRKGGR